MKIQRIPVLALAALLVTAGACGEQKVNTTGRAATAASSSSFRFGSADAAEHTLVHVRVQSSSYRYGSADAAEHAAGKALIAAASAPSYRYGSADAAEHAARALPVASSGSYRYGSADAAEHAAAIQP